VTFTLSEDPDGVGLRFRWEGGLEVVPQVPERLAPGSVSDGVRILDFTRDGDGWALTLEGDGGALLEVGLRGQEVTADMGVVTSDPARPPAQKLTLELPGAGSRVVRTIRLRPLR
jgi:hypothetical protein